MWKMNCAQLAGFDEAPSSKEAEIEALKERVSELEAMVDPSAILPIVSSSLTTTVGGGVAARTYEAQTEINKFLVLVNYLFLKIA